MYPCRRGVSALLKEEAREIASIKMSSICIPELKKRIRCYGRKKKILGIFAFMPSSYMCQTVMTGTPTTVQ